MEPSNSYLCAVFAVGLTALAFLFLVLGRFSKSWPITKGGWIFWLMAAVLWIGAALFKLGILPGG